MIELHSQTATHIMEDLYLPHEPDDCLREMLEDIRGPFCLNGAIDPYLTKRVATQLKAILE